MTHGRERSANADSHKLSLHSRDGKWGFINEIAEFTIQLR